jgi:hypothetical protein
MTTCKTTSGTAAELIPPRAGLSKLRAIAAGCKACPLRADAKPLKSAHAA